MRPGFAEKNQAYQQMTDAALLRYMDVPEMPARLRESMLYSLMAGGKRLRPCLALACCEMLSGELQRALPLACALEMIHCYSLIHDDLPCMDNDDYRRGKPTNHRVFGEGHAILAGDGLLSYAFEIMLDAALDFSYDPGYMAGARSVARGAGVFGMVAGQSADLLHENDPIANADTLVYIHTRKTGALIRASLLAGACAAGHLSGREFEAVAEFGEHYGLLFQITDDILDVEGDSSVLGKSIGKDAEQHKLTYPALYGISVARAMAEETAKTAKASLQPFGEDAAYFLSLVDYTHSRRA